VKVWITKYALTSGVFDAEVEESLPGMVKLVTNRIGHGAAFHGEGRDWHRTLESALARCEAMRAAKLKSLEKQALKVRALNFERMVKP